MNVNSTGINFFGMLQILFIGLKLTDYIDWSWWWVLSPILFGIGIFIIVLIGLTIVYFKKKKQFRNTPRRNPFDQWR